MFLGLKMSSKYRVFVTIDKCSPHFQLLIRIYVWNVHLHTNFEWFIHWNIWCAGVWNVQCSMLNYYQTLYIVHWTWPNPNSIQITNIQIHNTHSHKKSIFRIQNDDEWHHPVLNFEEQTLDRIGMFVNNNWMNEWTKKMEWEAIERERSSNWIDENCILVMTA